jgi:hypothetical protein
MPNNNQRGTGYLNRRDMLQRAGFGFGSLALSGLLGSQAWGDTPEVMQKRLTQPMTRKEPHIRQRAKNVIFLFMEGGPSHIDLFDPKPELNKRAGEQLPDSFGEIILPMGESGAPLLGSKRKFKQVGENGTWVSDWIPHISEHADDFAVIRSCWGNGLNHANGVCQMNTCDTRGGRPSLGSWVSYGLGTENQNLPAYVVIEDNFGKTVNGPRNWSAGFMPASFQGTALKTGTEPIANLKNPVGVSTVRQQRKLAYLKSLNGGFAEDHPEQTELEARIRSYELAFRMQAHAPEAISFAQETAATQEQYGIGETETDTFGRNCLLARRLVERGVRFVQLYHGAGSKWDAHKGIEGNHSKMCKEMDKPVAGLLADLKQRGLLEETLVVWGGEFGRTPMSEQGDGRDHNPYGFTVWMAGGGIKGGLTYGATDEFGMHAIEGRMHIHDLHATILYALGLDNMKLEYLDKGRPQRPTVNEGGPNLDLFV